MLNWLPSAGPMLPPQDLLCLAHLEIEKCLECVAITLGHICFHTGL